MKALIEWIVARRVSVVAVAVVFARLFSIVTASIIALRIVQRGAAVGIGDALVAALALTLLSVVTNDINLAIWGCLAIVVGIVIGGLSRASRNLTLVTQLILVAGYIGVIGFSFFVLANEVQFKELIADVIREYRQQGIDNSYLEMFAEGPIRLVGVLGVQIVVDLFLVLAVTWWALGRLRDESVFGTAFREFRLGYVLTVPGLVVVLGSLVYDYDVLLNMLGVATFGFVLHGLALVHRQVHAHQWDPIVFVPVYVLGIPICMGAALIRVFGIDIK